jgi:hypothetical protein
MSSQVGSSSVYFSGGEEEVFWCACKEQFFNLIVIIFGFSFSD